MNRYLEIALKLTGNSNAKHQRMAALVVRGGAIFGSGFNRNYDHAEKRALRPYEDYSGATIYVMRHNRGCSRPCNSCQQLIINAGIKRAVYISLDGNEVTEVYRK